MEMINNLIAISAFVFLICEFTKVFIGLEKHEYIGGKYDHSIQHFVYLLLIILAIVIGYSEGVSERLQFVHSLAMLTLVYHLRKERLGQFK